MMSGMMIPSVAPMVLAHAGIVRRRAGRGAPYIPSALFLAGYLISWSLFSFVATGAQWVLYHSHLLDGRSLSIGPWAGAVVLVSAGAFQFSPAKNACLDQCRAPVGYFMTEWREGRLGAVAMGLHHGLFCIGCCWLLMAVLFSAGIMNLLWGAIITAFVILEKVLPWPRLVVAVGGLSCFAGAAVLVCGRLLLWESSMDTPPPPWHIAGSYYEVCNCEVVCPCRRQNGAMGGKPTYENCDFALSWWIKDGALGAIDLADMKVVMAGRWETTPGDPWRVTLYVDDRATAEQHQALADLFLGKAGGYIQSSFAAGIVEVFGVKSATIKLDHARARARRSMSRRSSPCEPVKLSITSSR